MEGREGREWKRVEGREGGERKGEEGAKQAVMVHACTGSARRLLAPGIVHHSRVCPRRVRLRV